MDELWADPTTQTSVPARREPASTDASAGRAPVPAAWAPDPPVWDPESAAWAAPPSGLFPRLSNRPAYREPHPATPMAMAIGVAVGSVWMLIWALYSHTPEGFVQLMLLAGLIAGGLAVVLAKVGDRGAAAGVAIAAGGGLSLAGFVVAVNVLAGNWLS